METSMEFIRKHTKAILGILLVLFLVLLGINFIISTPSGIPEPSPFIPYVVNPQGDTILFEDQQFRIIFIPQNNEYQISVLGSPFIEYRTIAEQKILEVTKLTPSEICNYKVIITTPSFANPDVAGIQLPLSYCPRATVEPAVRPTPRLTVNSSLEDLRVVSKFPKDEIAEVANTTNAISVSFNKDIDATSLAVSSSPDLKFNITVYKDKPKIALITPKTQWQINETYTITILAGATSVDKKSQLKANEILKYTIKPVPAPAEEDYHGDI